MAQRQGDSVSRIVRFGWSRQLTQTLYHIHYLSLLRASIADHRLFDLQGRILIYLYPLLAAGQQNHTSAVRNRNTGGDVRIEKQLFNGNGVRLEQVQQLQHIVINLFQAA